MQKYLRGVLVVALAGLAIDGVRAQTLTSEDIGATLVGSTTVTVDPDTGGNIYTIVGGGADIWGAADGMRYAYMEATGDWDYVVKVRDLQGPDAWSKAELMARESHDGTSLFVTAGDRHVSQMTTRAAGQNQVAMQWRHTVQGTSQWASDVGMPFAIQRPTYPDTWLRLKREGEVFLALAGSDGVNWELSSVLDTAGGPPFWNGPDSIIADKLAIGLAVTAHNDADAAGATAVFSDFGEHVPIPVAIATQPPATVDMSANSVLTLTAVATGDICKTEWRKDGVLIPGTEIIGGGTVENTYTVDLAQISDSGSYTLYAEGDLNNVTSSAAVVTVTVDTTPPTITRAIGAPDRAHVVLTFSEPVKAPSATTAANYSIAGLGVTAAALSTDERQVTLTTAAQTLDTQYTITVNNVQDGGGNTIAAGTTIVFNSAKFANGLVQWERWNTAGGIAEFITAIEEGTMGPPDVMWNTTVFESGRDLADNYRGRGYAWFRPPTTADYRFIITADDNARLYLSTDDDPANKVLIAGETGWSNNREWTAASEEQDSKISSIGQWPTFEISLVAGQDYYLEALWQEGGGGDGVEVTWTYFNDAVPANGTVSVLAGDQVGVYVDPSTLPPVMTTPTANSAVTVAGGGTTTLSVAASGATSYQWQWNGVDIPGATGADYVISDAQVTQTGQYWAFALNENGSVRSPLINVLVTATGVFNIEAEDFDYDGGQAMPAASVMPYLGGAYNGLSAIHGVDYLSAEDLSAPDSGWTPVYRTGAPIAATTTAPMENQVPGGQFAITRMGEWEMTANYKIGWISSGDWGNYTRTFPTPAQSYWVFAASSFDGTGANQINHSLGLVTAGVGTDTQTVEPLGNFTAPGTGGWSRNNLVALTDGSGAIKTVEIGGLNTIRWNYNSGDAESLMFVPATGGPDEVVITSIIREGSSVTVTWTGGGEAEVTDDLGGSWTPTGDTDGSFTATLEPGNAFLRIRRD